MTDIVSPIPSIQYLQGMGFRTPKDIETCRCSSLLHKIVQYLHITYTCPPCVFYITFRLLMIHNTMSMLCKQLLARVANSSVAFANFLEFFSFQNIFLVCSWLNPRIQNLQIWRANSIYIIHKVHAKSLQSCLTLGDPMDCTHQTPLSMRFSR